MVGGVGVLRQSALVEGDKMRGDRSASKMRDEMGTVFCAVECVVYMNISSLQYKNQEKRMGKVRTIRKNIKGR